MENYFDFMLFLTPKTLFRFFLYFYVGIIENGFSEQFFASMPVLIRMLVEHINLAVSNLSETRCRQSNLFDLDPRQLQTLT